MDSKGQGKQHTHGRKVGRGMDPRTDVASTADVARGAVDVR
jgi:hypothetical protein